MIGAGAMLFAILFSGGSQSSRAQDAAVACPLNKAAPTIKGTYIDNFGGPQNISASYWTSSDLVFEVCSVDNVRKRIIAQNDVRNQFNPGKFSRFEWTTFGNRLWYCQSVFDAPTPAAADAAPPANPSNPVDSGCGQFGWSTLIKLLP
jgi:hypothetical protein